MVTMNRNKVVIVGTGQVGATAAFGIVTHGLCNELVLIDCSAAKALGEARDLDDGSEFQDRHVKVRAGDYADCKDADIVVITVGRKPPANSNRMAELGFTVGLVGEVVDNVMASGFDGVIVMVSNPVDVMAWYAWKRSGLPRTQVLGTGTALDTSRLKTIIGEETGLDPRNVGGFVMGEHGDSQFTAWSTVSLGGKPFARFLADNQDRFASVSTTEIEEKTRTRGNEIVAAKGGTNFGIASTVAGIVQTILWDERRIVPVSTLLDGGYIPVIATVGMDDLGQAYNVNADTAAAQIAIALKAEKLVSMTDIAGLLRDKDDETTLIPEVEVSEIEGYKTAGIIAGGMIPKIGGMADAIYQGVHEAVIIDGRVPHSILLELFSNRGSGTRFYRRSHQE